MTEDQNKLLAALDVRVRDLMSLCDKQRMQIGEMRELLTQKEQQLQEAQRAILDLNTKCDRLLTARVVSVQENDVKSARARLSKLVREVDKCIALLNE
ncbi:MAG: hypothetical protein ACI30I_09715 [Parabacteroides sp.]